jgi:hypothetical protein
MNMLGLLSIFVVIVLGAVFAASQMGILPEKDDTSRFDTYQDAIESAENVADMTGS